MHIALKVLFIMDSKSCRIYTNTDLPLVYIKVTYKEEFLRQAK